MIFDIGNKLLYGSSINDVNFVIKFRITLDIAAEVLIVHFVEIDLELGKLRKVSLLKGDDRSWYELI